MMKRIAKTLPMMLAALLLAAIFVLAGCAPAITQTPKPIAPTIIVGQNPTPGPQTPVPPTLLERRLLTVDWPRAIRVGDSDRVRLLLEVDAEGRITPTVSENGHVINGGPIDIPDLYVSHNLVIEARLDLAGMDVQPQSSISETLRPGQAVTFFWSISPRQAGDYRGTLWLYLNLVPKGGGDVERLTLLAMPMQARGLTFLGLPAWAARWMGAIGSLFGFVFSFPFIEAFLTRLWRWIRNKLDKKS